MIDPSSTLLFNMRINELKNRLIQASQAKDLVSRSAASFLCLSTKGGTRRVEYWSVWCRVEK